MTVSPGSPVTRDQQENTCTGHYKALAAVELTEAEKTQELHVASWRPRAADGAVPAGLGPKAGGGGRRNTRAVRPREQARPVSLCPAQAFGGPDEAAQAVCCAGSAV